MISYHPDEPCYVMSIAARMVDLHPQTLRRYEVIGLIKPCRVSGRRLYSQKDIERLQLIVRLTDQLGVNLAGVEVILGMRERIAHLQEEVDQMQSRFEQEDEHVHRIVHRQQEDRHSPDG